MKYGSDLLRTGDLIKAFMRGVDMKRTKLNSLDQAYKTLEVSAAYRLVAEIYKSAGMKRHRNSALSIYKYMRLNGKGS